MWKIERLSHKMLNFHIGDLRNVTSDFNTEKQIYTNGYMIHIITCQLWKDKKIFTLATLTLSFNNFHFTSAVLVLYYESQIQWSEEGLNSTQSSQLTPYTISP